jgi:hypothetical protein
MAAIANEFEHQTMTSVGKVSVTDDSTTILLGLIGLSTLEHGCVVYQENRGRHRQNA